MRYLLLVLLLISKTVTADCFVVTELMTKWQFGLDALGMPVGEFKNNEFRITINEEGALVSPGNWNCLPLGNSSLECGEELERVRLDKNEVEQLKKSGEIGASADTDKYVYTVTKGVVKQIWHLFLDTNKAVLLIPEQNNMKQYSGVIKGKC